MARMLAMIVNEGQDYWDAQLPYVVFTYNDSVSDATGDPQRASHGQVHASLLLFSISRGSPAIRA